MVKRGKKKVKSLITPHTHQIYFKTPLKDHIQTKKCQYQQISTKHKKINMEKEIKKEEKENLEEMFETIVGEDGKQWGSNWVEKSEKPDLHQKDEK
jgi:hypothetical protein